MWCVRPTTHSYYLDVVDWCCNLWGSYRIKGIRDGSWGYASGLFYGLTQETMGYALADPRLYFAFKNKDDAVTFMLRWV